MGSGTNGVLLFCYTL